LKEKSGNGRRDYTPVEERIDGRVIDKRER